jgi:hypothetical protein
MNLPTGGFAERHSGEWRYQSTRAGSSSRGSAPRGRVKMLAMARDSCSHVFGEASYGALGRRETNWELSSRLAIADEDVALIGLAAPI